MSDDKIDMPESSQPTKNEPGSNKPAPGAFSMSGVWIHFTIALIILALFQAPRLASSLEDLSADVSERFAGNPVAAHIVPAFDQAAEALRLAAEKTGITYAGDVISKTIDLGVTDMVVGKIAHPHMNAAAPQTADFPAGSEPLPSFNATMAGQLAGHLAQPPTGRQEGEPAEQPIEAQPGEPADQQPAGLPAHNATASADPAAAAATTAAADSTADSASTAAEQDEDDGKPLILLVGDSLMMEGLGPAMLKELRGREDLRVVREAKYSTGLSRKDYFDWPAHMEELVDEYDPDIVVITLGGNDAQDIIDDNKKRHIAGTATWEEQYALRAKSLVEAAQKNGAYVIWVGLPIMGNPTHAKRTLMLSEGQKAACSTNSTTQAYVDTLDLLTDDKGEFTAFVKNDDGKQIRIRYKDKIHVTTAGGEIMIKEVMPCLEEMLKARAAGSNPPEPAAPASPSAPAPPEVPSSAAEQQGLG